MEILNLTQMREKKWPVVEPIISGGLLLPRARLLIAGKYKAKKSFLTIQASLEMAAGRPFLGTFEVRHPVSVLYVNAEISEHSFVVERVLPMSEQYPEADGRFHEAFTNYRLKLSEKDWPTWVEAIQIAKAQVLVVDPLAEVAMGDENSKTDAQRAGDFLNSLITETGVSVILIHHESKDLFYEGRRVDRGWDAVRGSSYWPGWLDSGIRITRVPDKGIYHLAFLTRHTKEPDPLELMWDEQTKLFMPAKEQGMSLELLRREFDSDVILEQDLVTAVSIHGLVHPMTVKRAINGLVARGEVEREAWIKDKRKHILRKTGSWGSLRLETPASTSRRPENTPS